MFILDRHIPSLDLEPGDNALDVADALGLLEPTAAVIARPDLFQCWEDRALQVLAMFEAGRDAIAMRKDADLYGGHLPSSEDPFGMHEISPDLLRSLDRAESQAKAGPAWEAVLQDIAHRID